MTVKKFINWCIIGNISWKITVMIHNIKRIWEKKEWNYCNKLHNVSFRTEYYWYKQYN